MSPPSMAFLPGGLYTHLLPSHRSPSTTLSCLRPATMSCSPPRSNDDTNLFDLLTIPAKMVAAVAMATTMLTSLPIVTPPAEAATTTMRLPPIDRSDANRCYPTSSAIGQANAARDKLLDLRECDLRKADLRSFDLSGTLFSGADVSNAVLSDAQLSKSYALNANFSSSDFTNAVVDRVTFDGANLSGAIFANAVLSDSTFEGANLENVDFSDVYIGDFAQRSICRNPSTKGTNPTTGVPTRESLGCR